LTPEQTRLVETLRFLAVRLAKRFGKNVPDAYSIAILEVVELVSKYHLDLVPFLVFTTIRNKLRNEQKKELRRRRRELPLNGDPVFTPIDPAKLLDCLPDDLRILAHAKWIQGLCSRVIREQYGLTKRALIEKLAKAKGILWAENQNHDDDAEPRPAR
jgi:hypothetical protein